MLYAEFISALINIYDPLKNALSHKLQIELVCSACENTNNSKLYYSA
jgi:hypothetical protein